MNIHDISFADRASVFSAISKWMSEDSRYSYLEQTKHDKILHVSVGTPAPIKGGPVTVPVTIQSKGTGFDVKVAVFYAMPEGPVNLYEEAFTTIFPILQGPSPGLENATYVNYRGRPAYGAQQTVSITQTTQLVNIQLNAIRTIVEGTIPVMPFYVLVSENLNLEYFDHKLIDIADAQGQFTFSYDAPVLSGFSASNIRYGFLSDIPWYGIEETPRDHYGSDETRWEKDKSRWKPAMGFSMSFSVLNLRYPSDFLAGIVFSETTGPTLNPNNMGDPNNWVIYKSLKMWGNIQQHSFSGINAQKAISLPGGATLYARPFAFNGKASYGQEFTINTPIWGDGEIL